MKKIPCVFQREFLGKGQARPLADVTPGCEWVLAGEGVATIKRDGSVCIVLGGRLYRRFDAKHGKLAPAGAIPCDPAPDPVTGHWPHWVEVDDGPDLRWHREAWARFIFLAAVGGTVEGATYELCGPRVSGNRERMFQHVLFRHGAERVGGSNLRTFDGLRFWLGALPHEGLVFHHPDGRMAKIRRVDFGLAWPPLAAEAA